MSTLFAIFLSVIVILLLILYKRWCGLRDHWKEAGIPYIRPYPLVGNMMDNVLRKKTMGEVYRDISVKFNDDKIVGIYNFITADLLINDTDYIHTVMVKEFSNFMDRGPEVKNRKALDKHIFLSTGAEWKGVRMKIAPAFTSGKLKEMLPVMLSSYENTAKMIDSGPPDGLALKDILEMYIISVSASTIFGIDPSRLTDPDSEFVRILEEVTKFTFVRFVVFTISLWFPNLSNKLGFKPMSDKVENYYIKLVLDTFKERIESGVVRNDIVQQLLQLKLNGKIEVSQWVNDDDYLKINEPASTVTETVEITDDMLVAQGFVFLMAGLDPLRSTLGMTLVELCQNGRVLARLRQEIEETVQKHKEFSFQALKEMQYLDMCISETLRLHPGAEFGTRYCLKDYTFPNGFTVKKGTRVIFPTLRFHMDANYFPEPQEFKPERFDSQIQPGSYLPFGDGPRMCIAKRFAMQEMKLLISKLVYDYDLTLDPRTEVPVKTDKWFFLRRHVSPMHINFTKRIQSSLINPSSS